MSANFYDRLGIKRGADKDEIKRAYRRLARMYHPDMNPSAEAHKKFIEITEAYEGLLEGRSYKYEYTYKRPTPKTAADQEEKPDTHRGHKNDRTVTAEELAARVKASQERKIQEGKAYYKRYKRSAMHFVSVVIAYLSIIMGVMLIADFSLPYQGELRHLSYKYEVDRHTNVESAGGSRFHLVFDNQDLPVDIRLFAFVEENDVLNFRTTSLFGQLMHVERATSDGIRGDLRIENSLLSNAWFYLFLLFLPLLRWSIDSPHVSFYFFDFGIRTGIFALLLYVFYAAIL